jgi:hypothetical protein
MNTIHFVTGGVGQGGKSLFCKTLIEFYLKHQIPFSLFDCDPTNPDVGLTYDRANYTDDKIHKQISFRDISSPKPILASINEMDTLVNLPSHSNLDVNKWFNSVVKSSNEFDKEFDIIFWFVSKPSPLNIQLLKSEFNLYGGKVRHVLVKNLMQGAGYPLWEDIIDYRTKEFLETSKIANIEMPYLQISRGTFKVIEHDYSILSEIIKKEDPRCERGCKYRTAAFLDEMMKNIEALNIIDIQRGKAKVTQS